MIVVTTPTGKIGSQVVQNLLAANEAVRVIVRDPARLALEVQGKVEVIQGSSDDESVLSRAFQGAESLFLVVPPSFATNNVRENYLQFARPAARAIKKQGVKRVVAVSALGRGLPMDGGVVSDSFAKDEEIERSGVDFRALWCPGFMENMLMQIDALKHQGMFFLPSRPDVKVPYVATRDIASVGARLLRDRSWTGQGGVAILGPENLSINDMAAIMTEVLGKPITYQQLLPDVYKDQLLKFGASEHFADRLVIMYAAKSNGLDNAEPRTPENTTPTSFRQWCEEVLKPAVLG
ncbi:NmrA family NAD(P)-binding protein [Edaphobacter albus]|uniref:NmrA family NAD(P)-binding protein n=1 Tax=Edaphobacter sp. 4G125 TaxID=2763071 RepID=UPI001646D854|nr:NmrA family NAD(P)-binding protein [Edaphobacter sp. 4G125]QNI36904.1 NmrA family NAD(P)-binding protein [Edaphobacter sp. 4G125]